MGCRAKVLEARGLKGPADARRPAGLLAGALNAFAVTTVRTGAGDISAQTPVVRGTATPCWNQVRMLLRSLPGLYMLSARKAEFTVLPNGIVPRVQVLAFEDVRPNGTLTIAVYDRRTLSANVPLGSVCSTSFYCMECLCWPQADTAFPGKRPQVQRAQKCASQAVIFHEITST